MPLLNEYKRDFVLRRLPQTLLGGLKLHLGYKAPFYVYTNQLLLFLIPVILGGTLTLIAELTKLRVDIFSYVYGTLMFVFVLLVQIISFLRTRKKPTVGPQADFIKHNILSEDDEIEFETCFGKETVEFVSPVKPMLLIPLHAVFSGLVSGLALWFLLPTVLNALFSNSVAATVLVSVFGWLAVCIGLYPLTVASPPELSQYRALVMWDVVPARPVHMAVCLLVHVVMVSAPVDLATATTVNQTVHIAFCLLPVLWLSGVLPTTEPLLLWLIEQAHVHVMGGSHMANPVRTVVIASLSALTLLVYLTRDSPSTVLLTLTACGYLLSLDLSGLFSKLLQMCLYKTLGVKKKMKRCEILTIVGSVVFYLLMLGLACAATVVTSTYNGSGISAVIVTLGYGVIGVYCLDLLLRNVQKVYWCGLVRNPLFPPNVNKERTFRRRKKGLFVVGVFRRILINFVTPLLLLVYVVSYVTSDYPTTVTDFWHCVTIARALRAIFQSSSSSLLDLSIHAILTAAIPATSAIWWCSLATATQLFVISLARHRTLELVAKLYTIFIMILETLRESKRFKTFCGEMFIKCGLPVILVPVWLVLVLVPAVALSAPLLPLFTLPFFWMAAPRPRHFWAPQLCIKGRLQVSAAEVSGDAVFYHQAVPGIMKIINRAISCGALDNHPGAQYLLRYQDRLVWVSVLESGFSYTSLLLKGLELQETSCHTAEAARIDDLFQHAFEREKSAFGFNEYCLNTLTPKDSCYISTYSDAKNVLTGIIDNPDNLKLVYENLEKALGWVILNYLLDPKRVSEGMLEEEKVSFEMLPVLPKVSGSKLPPLSHSKSNENAGANGVDVQPLPPLSRMKPTKLAPITLPKPPTPEAVKQSKLKSRTLDDCDLEELLDDWDSPRNSPSPIMPKPKPRSQTKVNLMTGTAVSPVQSETESVWSLESTDQVPLRPVRSQKSSNLLPAFSNRMDDFKVEDEDSFSPPNYLSNDNSRFGIGKADTNLLSDIKLKNPLSRLYAPPSEWMDVPLEKDILDSLVRSLKSTNDWYNLVIERVISSRDFSQNVQNLASDEGFCRLVSSLVAFGRWVYYQDTSAERAANSGSSFVYKSYLGHTYNSVHWLSSNRELKEIFLKAYRYSVKLMIDQAVLGPSEDLEEFADSFSEYDLSWYIGQESEPKWTENINNGTMNLLSISHSAYNNLYTSRTLSQIDLAVSIGSLNDELVRAQWANLSLELLYMTNDDEERDSIQAQANILRNLTVQAADPPLGYPLYTSNVLSVHNL